MAQTVAPAKASYYRVRAPLLKEGRMDTVMAETDNMQVRVKVYAQGGENALHTHLDQDHTFVVLQGQARFWDETGAEQVYGRNEGIMLPRGAYYRFESCGDVPLVMLRVAARNGKRTGDDRIGPDGKSLPGDSTENFHVEPVVLEGAFYE
jgi:mannose-6-phosphate isomerase-like protein (cupin superfamily)